MKSFIENALKGLDADYAEIRLEDITNLNIMVASKDVEKSQETSDKGGSVRVLDNGGWGFVCFNDFDRLKESVKEACELARIAGKGKSRLAENAPVVDTIKMNPVNDPRNVSTDEKISIAQQFSKKLKGYDEKIISSRGLYFETFKKVYLATNHGTFIDREDLDMRWGMQAIGKQGDVVQSVFKGFGSKTDFNLWMQMEPQLEQIGKETVELLAAEPATSGIKTVILDQRMAGIFIHEAFGHLSEADYIAENEKLKKDMALGSRFGSDVLNVMDGGGGELAGHRGSLLYDDEGVPQTATYLIRDGILAGRLHSRHTAELMNEKPTGNARTINYRFAPICRMTNTCINQGNTEFEDLLDGIEDGLYVVGSSSGNTSNEMFTFSAEKGFEIKNGKQGKMVRDFVLTGNVFTTLRNIDKVGNDLYWSEGGNCGRTVGQRLQYPLPVTFGSPHIRIQNLLVGGK